MTQVDTRGVKVSDTKTQATLRPIKGTASTPTQKVKVDDKAATRQAIIVALRRKGFDFPGARTGKPWSQPPPSTGTGTTKLSPSTTPATAQLRRGRRG